MARFVLLCAFPEGWDVVDVSGTRAVREARPVSARDEPDRADPNPGPAVIGPPEPERFMED